MNGWCAAVVRAFATWGTYRSAMQGAPGGAQSDFALGTLWRACSASSAMPYTALGITNNACSTKARHVKIHGKVLQYAGWQHSFLCAGCVTKTCDLPTGMQGQHLKCMHITCIANSIGTPFGYYNTSHACTCMHASPRRALSDTQRDMCQTQLRTN